MKKKRRLRKSVKLILSLLLVLVLSFITIYTINVIKNNKNKATSEPVVTTTIEPTKQPESLEKTTSASLFMVGDSLLHTTIEKDALQSDGTYNFTLLNRIGDIAKNYDIKYYNQETILGGDEKGISGYPTFNGPSSWGDYMVSLGFNVISKANNHCLDQGIDGINKSNAYWNQYEDIVTDGTFDSWDEYNSISKGEINDISYALISYTYGANGIEVPQGYEYAVAIYENNQQELLDKVERAKQEVDVVIVAIHWGEEYQTYPNQSQQDLALQLSNAGADIIIGNHPHCIQPIQWINDKTICFYALGNLCAAQFDLSRIEMMAALNITKTVDNQGNKTITIDDVHADLMYCYFTYPDPYCNDFEVIPFYQMQDNRYLDDYQSVYEQYKQIITQMDDSITVGGFN